MIILCSFSLILFSCRKTNTGNTDIEIKINEQKTENGDLIQIPEFVCENEEIQKNLRDLEKQTKELERIVKRKNKKGSEIQMRSYLGGSEKYPQVTVVWYVEEENSRLYNLMTLGADKRAGEPITCKEALERTELSGVDLSLKVGKLEKESGIRGDLQSMEMQGFKIGEDGKV